jgi:hypothetical protein
MFVPLSVVQDETTETG